MIVMKKETKEFSWREFLFDSSKQLILISMKMCEEKPELFPGLIELTLAQDSKQSQRASRIIYYLIAQRPDLFGKYIDEIFSNLEKVSDESIKFSLLKIFTVCKLPEDEEKLGLLTNICFDAVEAKVERIAIKVYAIDILYRISQIYPDLKYELFYLLEKYMIDAPPAFINRAGKLRLKISKELGMRDSRNEI
jgi:hypothetical protein